MIEDSKILLFLELSIKLLPRTIEILANLVLLFLNEYKTALETVLSIDNNLYEGILWYLYASNSDDLLNN